MNRTIKLFINKCHSQLYSTYQKPLNMCIVGSGPAGFYSAQNILKLIPSANIDIYEKLPVPFGLVRFGVAPDHAEVKNVINNFTKTANSPQVNFIGNVTLGTDVSLKQLEEAYHIVLLTYGAEIDKEFNIPGENLQNVLSARRFVGWYNGLPADSDLELSLNTEEVVILGQGNVAIDVARILLKSVDVLKSTDISSHALQALSESKVKSVVLVGRRGPLQVAFTIKEIREMFKLPDVTTIFQKDQMNNVLESIDDLPRPRKRLTQLIYDTSIKETSDVSSKKFCPLFYRSPLSFIGTKNVEGVNLTVNKMEGDKAVPTSEVDSVQCGMVLRSIGYRSVSVDPCIPFRKETSTVQNSPGLYAAGWLATGPTGVILSTMTNAFQTAQMILDDLNGNKINCESQKPGFQMVKQILAQKNVPVVNWAGWQKIDAVETEKGKALGKIREKIVSIKEMLEIGAKML